MLDGSGGEKVTRFVYDGDRVVEEYNGAGALVADYFYGNYIDEVLRMRRDADDDGDLDAQDGTYWYQHDDMFNVVFLTDPAWTGQPHLR